MHRSLSRPLALLIGLGLIVTFSVQARSKRSHKNKNSSFSYYMLVLSYAPDFCAQPTGDKDPRECGNGRHVGFVVHGLWPENENSYGPENCGSASPVSQSTVQLMLNYFPTQSLIQHEWKTHGTCTGLSADDYFALVRKARDSIKIPTELTPSSQQSMSPAEIQEKISSANPTMPQQAFRSSCYSNNELKELRICLNKDLSARTCGSSAGQCSAKEIVLLPVH